jgi:cbb3-type cytochrome c oxidase subunit III
MQPPHSKKTWTKIVKKMKSAFGCSIPDDQIPPLVKYLVGQNDIQATSLIEEARTQPPLSPKGEGNVGKGKTVYENNCVTCHGTEGKGDGPIGQVLVPPAGDLTATENKSDQDLIQTIQKGRPGTAMPSWKGGLSSQEIQDVLAYIRSLGH